MKVQIINLGRNRHNATITVKTLEGIIKYAKKFLASRGVDYDGDNESGVVTAGDRVVGEYKVIEWHYLDPDYRKDAPKDKLYCIRCQKEIKDVNTAINVDFDEATISVKANIKGAHLVGVDCWKKITK